jgi:hypothetical protein
MAKSNGASFIMWSVPGWLPTQREAMIKSSPPAEKPPASSPSNMKVDEPAAK